jgi:predicted AlkP superfamily phosphohydrolase/phosphomutase
MASDHGFGPSDRIFYANVWLNLHGYLTWKNSVPMAAEGKLTREGHKSHALLFDWSKTTASALTASSNGIYIHTTSDRHRPGVPLDEYDAFRQQLIAALLAYTDPSTGELVVKRVLTREEAFPGDYMHEAPDLTLVLQDHGFIGLLNAEKPCEKRPQVLGTHRPEGIFIAGGLGIQRGLALPNCLSILDVTPALLYSLGLPIPQNLEGEFVRDIFEATLLNATPPRIGEPTLRPVPHRDPRHQLTAEEEAVIYARLKNLGYLE